MKLAYVYTAAALALATGVAHSVIGEIRLLEPILGSTPLPTEPNYGRRLVRAVWHLPSVIWLMVALAAVVSRRKGGDVTLSSLAIGVFLVSGIGNLLAAQHVHPGGVLLLITAVFLCVDRSVHKSEPNLRSARNP
jgi:hypothetical protein